MAENNDIPFGVANDDDSAGYQNAESHKAVHEVDITNCKKKKKKGFLLKKSGIIFVIFVSFQSDNLGASLSF